MSTLPPASYDPASTQPAEGCSPTEANFDNTADNLQQPADNLQQPTVTVAGYQPATVQYNPQGYPTQLSNNDSEVVISQPTPMVSSNRTHQVGGMSLILSIVLFAVCLVCCLWYSLVCIIPAFVLSIKARDAQRRGDIQTAKGYVKLSMVLNIVPIGIFVIGVVMYGLYLGIVSLPPVASSI